MREGPVRHRPGPGRLAHDGPGTPSAQDLSEDHMSDPTNEKDEQGASNEGGSILDDGGINVDERAGRSLGIDPYAEPDEATKQQIEADRAERLDPANRP